MEGAPWVCAIMKYRVCIYESEKTTKERVSDRRGSPNPTRNNFIMSLSIIDGLEQRSLFDRRIQFQLFQE